MQKSSQKILLSGGGTGGSVTCLLALAETLRETNQKLELLFIGTYHGPERQLVEKEGIRFKATFSGKWRRYFSIWNFIDLFKIILAFFQAVFLLFRERPALIVSAGSFASVPLAWVGWLYRIPVLIHQQDVVPGLANKLMAPVAQVITVTFQKSLKDFGAKAIWTGNPVVKVKIKDREQLFQEITARYNLKKFPPLVLIIGGGTGSVFINSLVEKTLEELTDECQVIHVLGSGRGGALLERANDNYHPVEFLPHVEILAIGELADLVISRCGLGVLTELSSLGKASILIPMPNSHQEDNARVFAEAQAALVLEEKYLTPDNFIDEVSDLLQKQKARNELQTNVKGVIKVGANEAIVKIINNFIK